MTIGEKIYNLRTENKLSQDDLADELQVSRHTIGKWENNTVSPSAENLGKLCKFFNVNGDYFIGAQTEVAVTETIKSGKVSVYKVLLITLLSLLGVAFIVADVFLGLLVFSSNSSSGNGTGNDEMGLPPIANAPNTSPSVFWIMIAVTVVFIAVSVAAFLAYRLKKTKY